MPPASTTFWTASRRLWLAVIVLALLALGQSGCLSHLWSRLRAAETCATAAEVDRVKRDAGILRRLEAIYSAVEAGK